MNWEEELRALLNRNCAENGSGTPDFVLSHYLLDCLTAFNAATNRREAWYGREQDPKFGMPIENLDRERESDDSYISWDEYYNRLLKIEKTRLLFEGKNSDSLADSAKSLRQIVKLLEADEKPRYAHDSWCNTDHIPGPESCPPEEKR